MTRDLGQFDLIVVGGGVNGAGIARDAVGRGLSVLLCEKDDLVQGTSSRSGKLVHGGLRYLEYYEFRLVREALIEREVLLRAAPHLIWPMRFVLPHSPEQRPACMVRAGLFLYDHLGGRKILAPTRSFDLRRAPEGDPLRKDFSRAFEYSDCWVDDARLVVLNALDVRKRGGTVLTRTPLTSARRVADTWRVDLQSGKKRETLQATGKILVNAAGPWVEDVLHRTGRNAASCVRLVKGSHIVTRKFWNGDQAYLLQNSDKRVIFVNPYEGDLALIGTTDIPFEGRAEDVRIERSEVEYLLSVVDATSPTLQRLASSSTRFSACASCSTTSQPIQARSRATTSSMSRRRPAKPRCCPSSAARSRPIASLRSTRWRSLPPSCRRCRAPGRSARRCPGGDIPDADFSFFLEALRRSRPWLPQDIARGYARRYGTRVESLLKGAKSTSDLGRPFAGTLYEREARFLAQEELATEGEDVFERRTKHGLHLTDTERAQSAAWFQMLTPQAV